MHVRFQPVSAHAAPWSRWTAAFVVAFFLALGAGIAAYGASAPPSEVIVAVTSDFGSPPSGQIPILYNDHHVYSRPDVLRASRVLAALVKGGVLLVPLRSMFEQMGATVTYDAATRSFTVQKTGASIRLALGAKEAVINGETRPLDQGPIMYHGVALVPIRVISETMGAYVEWEPSQRLAVVRYIPPTPPPTPVPATPAPAPTTAPTPAPAATVAPYLGFIQGGFAFGANYNEFVDGGYCRNNSYAGSGAVVLPGSPIAVKVDFRQDAYVTDFNQTDANENHLTGFATIDGGTAAVPVFLAKQSTIDARVEYKIASPNIYVGAAYVRASNNYGYPLLTGVGGGIEKLPDLGHGISYFGSAFYFPSASGNYTVVQTGSSNVNKTFKQQYGILKYDVGLAWVFWHPVYVYGGFSGDRYTSSQNAPIGQTHAGPYVGLGVRF